MTRPGRPNTIGPVVRDRFNRIAELLRGRIGQRITMDEMVELLSDDAWAPINKTAVSMVIKRLRDEFGWQIAGGHKGVALVGPDPGPLPWPDEQDPFACLEDDQD